MEQSSSLPTPERPEAPAPPPPAGPGFAPPSGRAKLTVAALGVVIAIAVATIAADVYGLSAVNAGLDDAPDADSKLSTSDTLDAISAIASTLAGLATAVLFLRWFYRAYKNLPALGIADPPRSAGWAVGSWFVPFVNWVIPLASSSDIWRSGDTDARPDQPWHRRPVAGLVTAWWIAWLLSSVGGNIGARATWNTADELEEFKTAYIVDLIANAGSILAALLAIAFVRQATRRQEARARQVAAA